MPRPRSFRSSYEIMYMVPSYLFENLKKCLNTAQKNSLQHLNNTTEESGIKGVKLTDNSTEKEPEESLSPFEIMESSNPDQASPGLEEEAAVENENRGSIEDEVETNSFDEVNDEINDESEETPTPGPSPKYKCSVCSGLFSTRSQLANHKIQYHPIPKKRGKKTTTKATSGSKAPKKEVQKIKRYGNVDPTSAPARKRKSIFDDDDESDKKRLKVTFQRNPPTIKNKPKPQGGSGIGLPKLKNKSFVKWF